MNLSCFLQQNAIPVSNVNFQASKRFLDDEKNPVMWEIKAINSSADEEIRRSCTKRGASSAELDYSMYMGKLAARCTIFPNLSDAALQDSYGVLGDDNLLKAMLSPGEYSDYIAKVQRINGFDVDFSEKVKIAKN